MPELIDKAKLLEYLAAIKPDEYVSSYGEAAVDVINHVETYVNEMPTVEQEERRGRWIRNATSDGYHCSNCGHHADSPIGEMIDPRDYECYLDKYCGGCGAQMYADGGTISKERIAEIMTEILGGADNDA